MSVAAFRPVRKLTVAEDILGQIKALLRRNRVTAGSRLPSERELARRLGVSRPSVREALRTLALLGVVDTRHGSGSHLAGSAARVLRAPLEFVLMLEKPSLEELHETRELLDVFLAGRAAERRTPEDLRALERELGRLKEGMDRRRNYVEPDFRFHEALWEAAHHPLLRSFTVCLQEHVLTLIGSVKPYVHDWKSSYAIHERIYRAIRAGLPERARRAMKVHHEMMRDELRRAKLVP
ncbi:MAG: FadR/GntR family transcriptional regulator [Planctomycetota bacterium]